MTYKSLICSFLPTVVDYSVCSFVNFRPHFLFQGFFLHVLALFFCWDKILRNCRILERFSHIFLLGSWLLLKDLVVNLNDFVQIFLVRFCCLFTLCYCHSCLWLIKLSFLFFIGFFFKIALIRLEIIWIIVIVIRRQNLDRLLFWLLCWRLKVIQLVHSWRFDGHFVMRVHRPDRWGFLLFLLLLDLLLDISLGQIHGY